MTYLYYRGQARPQNEANIVRVDKRSRLSPRGRRVQQILTFYVQGEIQGTGSTLLTACNTFLNQFQNDYGDLVLTMDDGSQTPHQMLNSQSVSGVRIMHRSWSRGDAAELATKRTYSFQAQSVIDDCEDDLVYATERFRYIGNCGPRFNYIDTYFGPFFFQTAIATAQTVLQYGSAIGYSTTPAPSGCIFPEWEHQEQREIEYDSGQSQGQGQRFFETRWTYRMTSGVPLNAI